MSTIGIDFGSHNCVISVINKRAIDVIVNSVSERSTPSYLSYTNEERLIGESATPRLKSNYKNTCQNILRILANVELNKELTFSYCDIIEANGETFFQINVNGKKENISSISAAAALLSTLKKTAERALSLNVVETVISVPSWFTDSNIKCLQAAAEVANLKVLKFLPIHAAAALDYGIYRCSQFNPDAVHKVIFVDIGYGSSTVTIADFKPDNLEIKAVFCNKWLGGRIIDESLKTLIVQQIKTKCNLDVTQDQKTMMKINEAVLKCKKILSANVECSVSIDNINDDDFITLIKREDLETSCVELQNHLYNFLIKSFGHVKKEDLSNIEVLGGSIRVPFIHNILDKAIEEVYGDFKVSKTLNLDESVARGCALHAAMLSSRYKVKDFKIIDVLPFAVNITWLTEASVLAMKLSNGVVSSPKLELNSDGSITQPCLKQFSPIPSSNWLTFENKGNIEFMIETCYNQDSILNTVSQFKIRTKEKKTEKEKIKVTIAYDINRNLNLNAVLIKTQVVEEIIREKRQKSKEATTDNTEEEKTPEVDYEYVDVPRQVERTEQVALVIERGSGNSFYPTKEYIQTLKAYEAEFNKNDEYHINRKNAMNKIESYVYEKRDSMKSDYSQFFTDKNRQVFEQNLNETLNWIYECHHESATLDILTSKLQKLMDFEKLPLELKGEYEKIQSVLQLIPNEIEKWKISAENVENEEIKFKILNWISDATTFYSEKLNLFQKIILYKDFRNDITSNIIIDFMKKIETDINTEMRKLSEEKAKVESEASETKNKESTNE